jgi:peptidyl-tRNA hydrolase, PTH2 family
VKQVIVVNEALHLPRGKLAAQVAHASLAAFLRAPDSNRQAWLRAGMTKIVLACESASELQEFHARALKAGLPAALIEDAGRTVVTAGTVTCLGIGPAAQAEVDAITGRLALVQ